MRENKTYPLCVCSLAGREGILQCNFQMKGLQQNKNTGDMCSPVILSRVPVWPNTKMSIGLKVETDTQGITRLDHTHECKKKYPMKEKYICPASVDMSTLPNSVKTGRRREQGTRHQFQWPRLHIQYISENRIRTLSNQIRAETNRRYKYPCTTTNTFCREYFEALLHAVLDPFQQKAESVLGFFFLQRQGETKFDEKYFLQRRWCSI